MQHEFIVILGEKEWVLRPSFASISAIEDELRMGIIAVSKKLAEGMLRLNELVVILTQCLKLPAADFSLPDDYISTVLLDSGLVKVTEGLAGMLGYVLNGASHFAECNETKTDY